MSLVRLNAIQMALIDAVDRLTIAEGRRLLTIAVLTDADQLLRRRLDALHHERGLRQRVAEAGRVQAVMHQRVRAVQLALGNINNGLGATHANLRAHIGGLVNHSILADHPRRDDPAHRQLIADAARVASQPLPILDLMADGRRYTLPSASSSSTQSPSTRSSESFARSPTDSVADAAAIAISAWRGRGGLRRMRGRPSLRGGRGRGSMGPR